MGTKDKLQELLGSLRGISTPIGGVEWDPPKSEREIVYVLFQKLGNRRLIRRGHGDGFHPATMIGSLSMMRDDITTAVAELGASSRVRPVLEQTRCAMQEFQTFIENVAPPNDREASQIPTADVLDGLRAFRQIVGRNILFLGKIYRIELERNIRGELMIDGTE